MNCRGLAQQKKRRGVMRFIRQVNANVVFLQDTHLTSFSVPFFNDLWKGKSCHSCCSSVSRGTCILIDNKLQHSLIKEISSDCGNYVITICEVNTDTYAFISVYSPNRDCPQFFAKIFSCLEQVEVDFIVVGGDMNFTIDPEKDCHNYRRENNVTVYH